MGKLALVGHYSEASGGWGEHCTGVGLAHLGDWGRTVNEENCLIVSPQSFISFKWKNNKYLKYVLIIVEIIEAVVFCS